MRFKTNVRIFRGRMDLAPLVDVMFILVIFFLIRTSYDFQSGYKVDLPEGNAPIVAGNKMVVVIATKGEGLDVTKPENILYFFNNEAVSVEDLSVRLNDRINKRSITLPGEEGSRYPTISLKVDKNVPHQYVQKVFQIAYERRVQVNQVVSVPEN
ncbi:MAG: biopolymer transporter ExbD [Lentisphaeraceae bacterium]|nr:biopolymer transporter ExbD [Lentisphaeraceae bacterium]